DPATTPLTPSDYTQPWDSLSAEEREKEILRMQIYSAMTDRVDQNLGRIITQLEKTEKFENTLIIFLSDNGACSKSPTKFKGDLSGELGTINSFPTLRRSWANVSNTPLRNYKSDSYEGGIATPMIVHWPQGISQPGTINREPCHIIDWMPTLMQLAGASYPGESKQKDIHPYDGISLSPTFTGQPLQRGKPLFYEYAGGAAIQDGNYKLVFASKQWELFDVSVDTSESKNIIDQHPEIATRMKSEWATWYEEATGKPYPIKEKSPRQK
ncbi:MAG: sulfatase-like hydrolase/transferase, partial [Coraliomargarita sp.]|nr:sulfatase-like hydrolase/transferase [Coraliomargarita sp.]